MRVEIIIHEGKRRSVILLGMESNPKGYVMAPDTYEKLKPALLRKYGNFEEKEIPASPELLEEVRKISEKIAKTDYPSVTG